MPLINRFSRLFAADLHGVLDRMEEPDLLLKQAVREMHEQLGQSEREQQRRRQMLAALERRSQEVEELLVDIGDQLDLCFKAGKEDLARSFVRRRLEAGRRQQHIKRQRRHLKQQLAEGAEIQARNRERYEAMKQKAELFAGEQRTTDPEFEFRDLEVTDADVEVAFLKELERRQS